jgi:hypothetical protein
MKLLVLLIVTTAVHNHILTENGFEMSRVRAAPFLRTPISPYDRCFVEVEISTFHIMQVAKLILEKRYKEIFHEVTIIIEHLRNAIQCFVHPSGPRDANIDPQCVLARLKKASERLQFVIWDITNCNWSMARVHFEEAVDILREIRNC